MQITEDLLMAYADGEADAQTREAIEAAIALDSTLHDRVEAHLRLRGTVAGAFKSALNEPVPEQLLAAARGEPAAAPATRPAEIVDMATMRAHKAALKAERPPHRAWLQWGAIAACLVVGVVLARGLGSFGVSPMIADRHGTLVAQGALAQALDQQIAGPSAANDQAVKIGVSFRATDKVYCRTFQVVRGAGLAGLACHAPTGWQVRVAAAISLRGPTTASYRTAATAIPLAVSTTVDAMIDGQPLDGQAEAAARAKGWRE